MQAESFEIITVLKNLALAKEHGVDFLLERRHLWLRSKRQWAIMKVRNALFMLCITFFKRKICLMDSPIFTEKCGRRNYRFI